MQIHIVSKGIDVSAALSQRINDRLEEMMDKYIHRDGEAHISISKEGSGFNTSISVHLPSGATMAAHGNAKDAYGASDEALEHLEKRLRRYKRRLSDHRAEDKAEALAMYVLQNPVGADDDGTDSQPPAEPMDHRAEDKAEALAMYVLQNPVGADDDGTDSQPPAEPMVISEQKSEIRTMTVSMASLELGLTDASAVMFRNAAHGGLNVVFKRADGNVGWIDPQR